MSPELLEFTDNISHHKMLFYAIEHFKDFRNRTVARLNLHCREDLSCMLQKNGSTAKSVPCP